MPGIDQQIEQRKMQFGNNPQALQQRYGQSKQLLDLLALQQIAQEQQQKAQAMQMQMQQNPATIAQQVEQEVIQGKKAEMAQSISGLQAMRAPKRSQSETARGVAGALAQKQREQQSRMQNLAKQGVASQPARNMERMYDGGIVGFAGENGSYIPTEEEIDAAIMRGLKEGTILRSTPRSKVREMLIREKELGQTRETIGDIFTGIGRRAKRQATRGRPVEEGLSEKEKQERALASAPLLGRAPDPMGDMSVVSDSAVLERIVGGSPVEEEVDVAQPRATATTATTAAPTDPGLMQRMAQQKGQQMQELSQAGEDVLGVPELGALQAMPRQAQAPEMLRRPAGMPAPTAAPAEPSMQEQLLKQLMASSQQEQKDITSAREALEAQYGGRSKGRKFLDLFKRAAQAQAQGPLRTTNRAALAGLLGGMATAEGEEKETYKKGLESIAERQRALTQGQLGVATGLAGIKRGEALTEQGERGLGIEERRVELTEKQIEDAAKQFYDRLGLDYAKMGIDAQKAERIADIQEDSNRITEEFNNARTKQAKEKLAADYAQMMISLRTETREAVADAINDLKLSGLSESEQATEAKRIKDNAEKALAQQEKTLRAMQKAATDADMGSFTPTTGAAVSGSGIQVLGVE